MSDQDSKPPRNARPRGAQGHRLARMRAQGMKPPLDWEGSPRRNATLDCGWGRLVFAQTYDNAGDLAEALRAERPDQRDIAFYVYDPHVALAAAPQELFLDPSHAFRLDLATYRPSRRSRPKNFTIRRLATRRDADGVNAIYAARHMVPVSPDFFWDKRDARTLVVLVAEDAETGEILGSVMGVDHARAFDDPEHGCSLWCLAVTPNAPYPGIGEALVRRLVEHFAARGAAHMDLSVLHDNEQAIALYEKLGFFRLHVFAIKRRNTINEKLFIGEAPEQGLNPYARLIVDEARRRGIAVDVIDAEGGLFRLTHGGRSIRCRESLSELTSSVAMSICDDKRVTRRIVEIAGVTVPEQLREDDPEARAAFLKRHGSVVVKPARGEQGQGVSVGLETAAEMDDAITHARGFCENVIVEQCVTGEDLRLVVIDFRVVACALRRPPWVVGDGQHTVTELIEALSRRRGAATGGESRIPLDAETRRTVAAAGYAMEDVPPSGAEFPVRRTANLHTGGTLHDVTGETHPALIEAAIKVARAIDIPVVGVDFMVQSPREPGYAFIEANERPGLANHEPQPTAERFVDLLFPLSMPSTAREAQRRLATP